jgi:hypothetical protein
MHPEQSRANLLLGLLLLVVLPAWIAGSSPQAGPTMAALTVPEGNLPNGCRLRADVPAATPAVQPGQTIVLSSPGSSYPFPSNPWMGADRRLAVQLRQRTDGALRIPHGPPSAAEVAALEQRWVADIVEGYFARYTDRPERMPDQDAVVEPPAIVEVSAIRFNDARLATTAPSTPLTTVASRGVRERVVLGAVVAQVTAGASTDCFSAVAAYLRGLK